MLPHKCFKEYLIKFIVRTPRVTDDVVRYRLNELVVDVITSSFILQIWIGVCGDTLRVVELHVNLICPKHVKHQQIYYGLLPCVREGMVKVISRLFIVFFHSISLLHLFFTRVGHIYET